MSMRSRLQHRACGKYTLTDLEFQLPTTTTVIVSQRSANDREVVTKNHNVSVPLPICSQLDSKMGFLSIVLLLHLRLHEFEIATLA